MKKIKIFSTIALIVSAFSGCLKDDPNVDFSNLSPVAEISSSSLSPALNAPSSGLDYFKSATLPAFSKDDSCDCYLPLEVTFNVNIASEFPPTSDIAVTLAVDDAKRVAYNASGASTVVYNAAPDSIYAFTTKTGVVKAGSRLASFKVTFFPDKIDPTISYLLPISITDASGLTISGNLGTIYLHNLGNPLAGPYNVTGTRYNYLGGVTWVGAPATPVPANYSATTNLAGVKIASPDDATKIQIAFANVGSGYNYVITYNPASQTISFTYTDPILAYSNIEKFLINFTPPSPTQKASFHIITHYNNAAAGAGNDRIMDETFVHQ